MARKLSGIARRGCTVFAAAGAFVAGSFIAVDLVSAQGELRVSSPPTILPNPFTARAQEPESRPVEPESPRRGPVTYHNPFTTMPAAPPIDEPVRPGPISRWRPPAVTLDQSPVKEAVLSTDVVEYTRIPWDQLPPAESLRARAAARNSETTAPSAASAGRRSNPINFALDPLDQPEWVAPQRPTASPLSTSGQVVFNEPVVNDPFDEPSLLGPAKVQSREGASQKHLLQFKTSQITPAREAAQPLIVSDYSDSPDGYLAQAQQRAHSAESADDLSAIADLCQRGLAGRPPQELAMPLRRLAAWAHNRRGELLIDEDRTAEAIKSFQVAISLDPNCSLAIHNRAVTLAQQNETDAALRDFNRVIELNPGLAIAYRNRAELLASLGRFNEAVNDYSRAIDGLPDNPELYRARGFAWHRLGDFQHALADLNRSIRLDPNNADAFTERGNLQAERGLFDRALNDFRNAIAMDPQWAEAYRSMAWLQATCPNPRYRNAEEALAAATQAAELSPPDDCFVLDALAAAYACAGEFDEAARIQEQAVAVAATDFAEPLRERLTLYQQGQPYLSGRDPAIRAAVHESAADE